MRERERERDREREREIEKHKEREIERQTETDRQGERGEGEVGRECVWNEESGSHGKLKVYLHIQICVSVNKNAYSLE